MAKAEKGEKPAKKTNVRTTEMIPLKQIVMPHKRLIVRSSNGDLKGLVASIESTGQLQPAIVRPGKKGEFELLCGHRRFAAVRKAGLKELFCEVRTDLSDDDDALSAVWAENSEDGRSNLTATEQATVFKRFVKEKGDDASALKKAAKKFDCTTEHIRRTMRILEAPEPVIDRLNRGEIGREAVIALAQISDKPTYRHVAEELGKGNITTHRQLTQAAADFANAQGEETEEPADKRKSSAPAASWKTNKQVNELYDTLCWSYGVAIGAFKDETLKKLYKNEVMAAIFATQIIVIAWIKAIPGIKTLDTDTPQAKKLLKKEVERIWELHGEFDDGEDAEEKDGDDETPKKKKKRDAEESDGDESEGDEEEDESADDQEEDAELETANAGDDD